MPIGDHILRDQLRLTVTTSCCCFSVAQSCLTLCNPLDCSIPGFPVLHHLPEFAQTHVHWVDDAIQPFHPLSSPSPPALNLSRHQGLQLPDWHINQNMLVSSCSQNHHCYFFFFVNYLRCFLAMKYIYIKESKSCQANSTSLQPKQCIFTP